MKKKCFLVFEALRKDWKRTVCCCDKFEPHDRRILSRKNYTGHAYQTSSAHVNGNSW